MVLLEYEHLKQNDLFSTIKRNAISGDAVTVLVHNLRLLLTHADNIVSDNRIINNYIIGFTETHRAIRFYLQKLNFFNINFNNNENKFLSLDYRISIGVAVLNKSDANGVPTLSFKKHSVADTAFT